MWGRAPLRVVLYATGASCLSPVSCAFDDKIYKSRGPDTGQKTVSKEADVARRAVQLSTNGYTNVTNMKRATAIQWRSPGYGVEDMG